MHPLAFRTHLHRAREQVDDLGLRSLRFAGRHQRDFAQRIPARVEQLGWRTDLTKRLDDFLEGTVQIVSAYFPLPRKYLPDADRSLKCPHGVATQALIVDAV